MGRKNHLEKAAALNASLELIEWESIQMANSAPLKLPSSYSKSKGMQNIQLMKPPPQLRVAVF